MTDARRRDASVELSAPTGDIAWSSDHRLLDQPVNRDPKRPRPFQRPMKPVKIRLMTDDISGIALWPDLEWDYPGTPVAYLFGECEPEDALPISKTLRDAIRAWVDEFTAYIGGSRVDLEAHDRCGYALSQELQAELGADFKVDYHFETEEVRRAIREQPNG